MFTRVLQFSNKKYHTLVVLLLISLFNIQVFGLSNSIVYPTNPNFQTGISAIVQIANTSSYITTSATNSYLIAYGATMPTASLNATLSVMSCYFPMNNQNFGWNVIILSLSQTGMIVQATAVLDQVTYMKINFMVSSYSPISANYLQYNFNPATDDVYSSSMSSSIDWMSGWGTILFQYRQTIISLPYSPINGVNVAIPFISGFQVSDVNTGIGSYVGVDLTISSAGINSASCKVTVFGGTKLKSISIYYISYDYNSIQVMGTRNILAGSGTMGCFYSTNTCNPPPPPPTTYTVSPSSNSSFTTSSTQFSVYYPNLYLVGLARFIFTYDGTSSGNFDLTSISLSGTSFTHNFVFSGNVNKQFNILYNYLSLEQVYCASVSTLDIYYVYNQWKCDSACNATIQQYADLNNHCQLCGTYCFQCVGSATQCTACYSSQNRIINGNVCQCDSIGYYDDGSSVTCPKCNYTCYTCSGGSGTQCLSCNATNLRTFDSNNCPCNPYYYDNGAPMCVSCDRTCFTCSAGANTNCLTCNPIDFRTITTSNTCPCNIGYYDVSPNSICSACLYSCTTCVNVNTKCITCNLATNHRQISGNTCPCIAGFYDSGVAICQPCFITCATCNGPDITDCTGCTGALNRNLVISQCICKAKYYDYNYVCYSCDYTCYNCTGPANNQCINCDTTNTFRLYNTSSLMCYCKDGYFDSLVHVCQKCDYSCLTCVTAATNCLTCNGSQFRLQTGSSCPCNTGYVDVLLTGMCSKCDYSCETCIGTTKTQCLTCNTLYRSLSGGSCLCPVGYYDDGINVPCQPCNATCVTCINKYSTSCTSCNGIYFRTLASNPGSCSCNVRYYDTGALTCAACYFTCLTCSVISTNCTTCDTVNDFRSISSTFTCPCIAHYYEVNAQACSSCIATCSNCTGLPNNCTSCPALRFLNGTNCNCINGYFQDVTQTCLPCTYFCATCQNSTSTCLSCPLFTYRQLSGTNCPCIFGYYDNSVAVCTTCPYSCFGCTGPTPALCVACPSSSYRTLQTNGSCTCNPGFYDDGSSSICKACYSKCVTCSSFSVCQTCDSTLFRSLVGSSCLCNAGYYDNNVNLACQLCQYSCASCFGGASTNCYTCGANRQYVLGTSSCPCNNGFYQSLQVCYSCDSSCLTCSTISTNCTSCDTSIRYLSNFQCLCNIGYYQNGASCSPCDISCQSCNTSPTNCLSCNPSFLTVLVGNICQCIAGQYQNITSLVCLPCNLKCQTCTSNLETTCLTCNPLSHRTISGTSCLCNVGYYDTGAATCASCDPTCYSCYGLTKYNCSQCYPGAVMLGSTCQIPLVCATGFYYGGACITTCPNTTYGNSNICMLCQNNCKTCNSSTYCFSCIQNTYFNQTTNTCQLTCIGNTYINHTNNTCMNCPAGCLICHQRSGQLVCAQCDAGYYLMNYTTCVDGTVCALPNYVISGSHCFSCIYPCQTCTNLISGGCLSCLGGFSLSNGQCVNYCPIGYYSKNQICLLCDTNCNQCSSIACQLCMTGYYLHPILKRCVTNGYYYDFQTNKQYKCHPNCKSCTNSSFSSCISCNSYRGDSSLMAISGYCECWQSSIDLGNGTCDLQTYSSLQTYNSIVMSGSSSTTFISILCSTLALNFIPTSSFVAYQQSYSMLYFVNSSAVLQSDSVLDQLMMTNINMLINSKQNSNKKRLLMSIQSDQSLFFRGESWEYLFNWAIYTVIIIIFIWIIIFLTYYLRTIQCISKSAQTSKILQRINRLFGEAIPIIIHLLTINQISLYATVMLKIIILGDVKISYMEFGLSILVIAYYVGYWFRLVYGCCKNSNKKISNSYSQKQVNSSKQHNKLSLLTAYFKDQYKQFKVKSKNKKIAFQVQGFKNEKNNSKRQNTIKIKEKVEHSTSRKLFLPILMLRMILTSCLLVSLSENPIYQISAVIGVFVLYFVYSICCNPYPTFFKLFIHLNDLMMLGQICVIAYSVFSPQESRIKPSFVLLILNGLQVVIMLLFSILLVARSFFGICQQNQDENKLKNDGQIQREQHYSHQNLLFDEQQQKNGLDIDIHDKKYEQEFKRIQKMNKDLQQSIILDQFAKYQQNQKTQNNQQNDQYQQDRKMNLMLQKNRNISNNKNKYNKVNTQPLKVKRNVFDEIIDYNQDDQNVFNEMQNRKSVQKQLQISPQVQQVQGHNLVYDIPSKQIKNHEIDQKQQKNQQQGQEIVIKKRYKAVRRKNKQAN